MSIEVIIPHVGESIQEAILVEWFKLDGATVTKDEALCVIETDKVTLEVGAEADGVLRILVQAGTSVAVGTVLATIEPPDQTDQHVSGPGEVSTGKHLAPTLGQELQPTKEYLSSTTQSNGDTPAPVRPLQPKISQFAAQVGPLSPAVRRLISEKQLEPGNIQGTGPGGRITKGDVLLYLEQAPAGRAETDVRSDNLMAEVRKPMTPLRKRIAARLIAAKQQTAMVTTFNDINMGRVIAERAQFKALFEEKYHVALSFMPFFVKACVVALQEIPEMNASIDGDDIVYHTSQHIGVAIGSGRGLVVPVIRHAEKLGFAAIDQAIISYVDKVKSNRLELADLEGGTFTISNGGVYGSLLSTPLLNMAQSGILGMHRIENRPVVVDNQIVIQPMMYVALTYDHCIVDGREGVTFLNRVKELVENPDRLLMEV